jgi:hypothetical protein
MTQKLLGRTQLLAPDTVEEGGVALGADKRRRCSSSAGRSELGR